MPSFRRRYVIKLFDDHPVLLIASGKLAEEIRR
ncbi:unnamed protein product, partial [marine sediment metagenome]